MSFQKLGIIVPSRGLVFSRTMESVIKNIKGVDNYELYMAHDLPLPICFNAPLKKALDEGCDLLWFVEEDMLIPEGTLKKMIEEHEKGFKFVSTEYADRRTGVTLVQRKKTGEPIYTGMGCLLVDRVIFDNMEPPWLRTCVFHLITDDDTGDIDYEPHPEIPFKGYGTQDVWLSYNARKQGHPLHVINAKIGHMQLIEKSKDCENQGQHEIETIFIKNSKGLPFLNKTFGDW